MVMSGLGKRLQMQQARALAPQLLRTLHGAHQKKATSLPPTLSNATISSSSNATTFDNIKSDARACRLYGNQERTAPADNLTVRYEVIVWKTRPEILKAAKEYLDLLNEATWSGPGPHAVEIVVERSAAPIDKLCDTLWMERNTRIIGYSLRSASGPVMGPRSLTAEATVKSDGFIAELGWGKESIPKDNFKGNSGMASI